MAKWQHTDFGGVIYAAKDELIPLEEITQVRYGDSKTIDFMVTPDLAVTSGVPTDGCATAENPTCIKLDSVSVTADTQLSLAYQLPDCYDLKTMTEAEVKATLSAKGAEELRKAELLTIINKLKTSANDDEGIPFENLSQSMISILNTLQQTGAHNENIVFIVSNTAMNSIKSAYLLGQGAGANGIPVYNGVVDFRNDFLQGYGIKNIVVMPDEYLNNGKLADAGTSPVQVIGFDYSKVFTNIFCRKDPAIESIPISGVGYVDQLLMKEMLGTTNVDANRVCYAKGSIPGFDDYHAHNKHNVKKGA